MENGSKFITKIGDDGRAVYERHCTDHGKPKYHSNPHDHIIDWHNPVEGIPNFVRQINYWDGDVPEFDYKGEKAYMKSENYHHERTDYDFATIAEYLDSAARGTEVTFKYKKRENTEYFGSKVYSMCLHSAVRKMKSLIKLSRRLLTIR